MNRSSPLRVLWLCGLPEAVRQAQGGDALSSFRFAAWSWILGHLPPPDDVELHIAAPVLGFAQARTFVHEGATFHLFPQRRLDAALLYWRWGPALRRIYRQVRPDVVHGWGTESGYGVWAARLSGPRCVVSIQGLMKPYLAASGSRSLQARLILASERATLKRAGLLLTESLYSAALLREAYGLPSETIPHPLRSAFLAPDRVTTAQARRIIFTGTLCPRKGALDAVEAFLDASPVGWEVVFLGKGGDQAAMEALIKEHGGGGVRFVGSVALDEMIRLMKDAPIFLLPSRMDTGPTALKEALALGLWPVCYDNTGPQELIRRYRWGSLVPTGDTAGLAQAIRDATATRPWQDATARGACAARVKQDLVPSGVWRQLIAAYHRRLRML